MATKMWNAKPSVGTRNKRPFDGINIGSFLVCLYMSLPLSQQRLDLNVLRVCSGS